MPQASLNPLTPATQTQNIGATSTYDPSVIAGSNQAQGLAEQQAATPYSALSTDQAVAPMSGNQQLGYNAAQANAGSLATNDNTINSSWTNPTTQTQYMSPYENSVLKAQQAYATQQQASQVAAQQTQQGMNNSFGGSGAAIQNAQELQNYNLNTNAMEATGLQSAYSSGQQQFNTAQNEALAANNAETGALASTGSVAQQIAQSADNYNVTNYNNALNWAGTQAKQLAGVLNTMPKNSTSTRNTVGSSTQSGVSTLSGLAGLAGMGMTLAGGNGNTGGNSNTGNGLTTNQNNDLAANASTVDPNSASYIPIDNVGAGSIGGQQDSAFDTQLNSDIASGAGTTGISATAPSATSDSGYQNLSGQALTNNTGMTNPIGALQSMGVNDGSGGTDLSGFSSDTSDG